MTFKDIIRKLTSRKLWAAIAGVATGIATILGSDGSDIQAVAGLVTVILSAVGYMAIEGKVDAARIQNTVTEVVECVEELKDDE